jgi:hypothetical protein
MEKVCLKMFKIIYLVRIMYFIINYKNYLIAKTAESILENKNASLLENFSVYDPVVILYLSIE